MPLVHAHCGGCSKPIDDEEDNLIVVNKGKSEIADGSMLLQPDDEVWFGHEACYKKPFQQAQQFLQGYVYNEMDTFLREDIFKGKLEEFFIKKGWPTGKGI